MTSIALNNRAPYKTCVTHGFVVDLDGKKISKSGTYEKPTAADHFVARYGADLLRLWASSIDYTADVPFSEEMFTRLGDTYRRIRNTLRILLGNLSGQGGALYDPPLFVAAAAGDLERAAPCRLSPVDRWILHRLEYVIVDGRAAQAAHEFHTI